MAEALLTKRHRKSLTTMKLRPQHLHQQNYLTT